MPVLKPSRALNTFICASCRQPSLPTTPTPRTLTTTSSLRADGGNNNSSSSTTTSTTSTTSTSTYDSTYDRALGRLTALSNNIASSSYLRKRSTNANTSSTSKYLSIVDGEDDVESLLSPEASRNLNAGLMVRRPYRLHIYSTKHNTHITFVQPPKPASVTASSGISGTSASSAEQRKMVDVLLSLSAGNLGFRKAGRGSYDAAYQLAAFTFKQMIEKGMLADNGKIEVVLRGFGAGREAVTRALLGAEGRHIRGRVSAVVDATRLKQGGPRSKKPRRLG